MYVLFLCVFLVRVHAKHSDAVTVKFVRAAAFFGGLLNARNKLVLFGDHDRLE